MLGAASKGGSFSRRPGLPPEALVDSEMLERSFAELDAWDEWLENVDAFHPQFMRFPPFVVVSYAWGAREHPDADPGLRNLIFFCDSREGFMQNGGYLGQFAPSYGRAIERLGSPARDAPSTCTADGASSDF